jgi:hypothetical protein
MPFVPLRALGLLFAGSLLTASAHAQTWQQVTVPERSSLGTLNVAATAVNGDGNLVVVGSFTGTVTIGFFTLTSAGNTDAFVARLSPAGVWLQAERAGGPGADQATAVTSEGTDASVVVGNFASPTLAVGGTSLPNQDATGATTDIFAAHWSAVTGWGTAAAAGGTGNDYAAGVAGLGIGGNPVVVVGAFASPTFVAGATSLANAVPAGGTTDVFALRFGASGQGDWTLAARAGGPDDDMANAVTVGIGTNGALPVVVGSFASRSIDFGSTTLTNASSVDPEPDAFVARLGLTGWTQAVQAGSLGSETLRAVAADGGDIVVAGDFSGPTTAFGPTTLTNADAGGFTTDIVVARLDAAGTWTQAVRAGSTDNDFATALATTGIGTGVARGAVVAGTFAGPMLPLGTLSLPNVNAAMGSVASDVFVARVDASGTWTQALAAGGTGADYATAVSIDAQGHAYVGGVVSRAGAQFGPLAVPVNTAGETGFVAQLGGLPTATRGAVASLAGLTVFPNPMRAGAEVTLTYEGRSTSLVQVTVLDALGRAVGTTSASGSGRQHLHLPTATLPAGMYLVRVQVDGATSYQRLVVE